MTTKTPKRRKRDSRAKFRPKRDLICNPNLSSYGLRMNDCKMRSLDGAVNGQRVSRTTMC
mgnify:CR=1 FL=1